MLAWRETGCRGSWWAAEGGADVWVIGVSGTGASAGHVEAGRARELAEIDRWAQVGSEGDARVDAGERERGLLLTGSLRGWQAGSGVSR